MMAVRDIPEEIDYSQFKWLKKGDRLKIAEKTGLSPSMVRHTLQKRKFNLDILAEAMALVVQAKKKVLERQQEAKQLSNALK